MANVKITELPVATVVNDADSLVIVQAGVTKQAPNTLIGNAGGLAWEADTAYSSGATINYAPQGTWLGVQDVDRGYILGGKADNRTASSTIRLFGGPQKVYPYHGGMAEYDTASTVVYGKNYAALAVSGGQSVGLSTKFVYHDATTTPRFEVSQSGTVKINNNYELPSVDGTANQVLTTNGAGISTWQDAAGGGFTDLTRASITFNNTPSSYVSLGTASKTYLTQGSETGSYTMTGSYALAGVPPYQSNLAPISTMLMAGNTNSTGLLGVNDTYIGTRYGAISINYQKTRYDTGIQAGNIGAHEFRVNNIVKATIDETEATFVDTVNATAFVGDGSGLTNLPAGTTYAIDQSTMDQTGNWLTVSPAPGGDALTDRLYFMNRAGTQTWRGTGEAQHGGYQFNTASSSSTALVIEEGTSNGGTQLLGYTYITGGDEGLTIEGKSGAATKSTIKFRTNGNINLQLTNNEVLMPGLPTADPVNAGQLWNDSGTLKISAG